MSREHNRGKLIFDCTTSPVANWKKLSYPSFEKLIFVVHTHHNSVKHKWFTRKTCWNFEFKRLWEVYA